MIALHGFMGSPQDWHFLPEARAVALPGHDHTPIVGTSFEEVVYNFGRNILKEPTTLVGYSMGGRVALYLALKFPGKVKNLVLISSSPGIEDPAERKTRYQNDLALADRIESQSWPKFIKEWGEQPLFVSPHNQDVLKALYLRRKMQNPIHYGRALRILSVGNQPSLWEQIEVISCPLYLITGELDSTYCQIAEQIKKRYPQTKWESIPEANHALLAESYEEILRFVSSTGFVDRH